MTGLSVIFLIGLFAFFSDENNADYDFSGIAADAKASTNGYIFYLDTEDSSIRCYYSEEPADLGHYAVRGSFSDDMGIFFVESMILLDETTIYDE